MSLIGTKLGRYIIRSKIGARGMGEVYLAEDTTLKRNVAVKLLPHNSLTNNQAKNRFLREARAAATVGNSILRRGS
jgi:serine/threonine-protein kinase